jgi:hypothetical protein
VAEGWYGAISAASVTETLRSGLKLVSGNFALEYKADDVVPLAEDMTLGCWSSVRQVTPAEAHWILVKSERAQVVAHYLETYADKGWQLYQRPGLLPPGWTIFRDVVINATPQSVPASLLRISPTVRERPALYGGLPLLPGQNTYLLLGEPDLWVPVMFDAAATYINIDGERRVRPESGRLSTQSLGLGDGVHQIEVGPSHLQFGTIRTLGAVQARQTGNLAHAVTDNPGHAAAMSPGPSSKSTEPAQYVIRISGAFVQAPPDSQIHASLKRPLLLPKGAREYVLLGRSPGEIQRVRDVTASSWLQDLPLYPKVFEVTPHFDVVWVIIDWIAARPEARVKSDLGPTPSADGASQQAVLEWRAQFARDVIVPQAEASLWLKYAVEARG